MAALSTVAAVTGLVGAQLYNGEKQRKEARRKSDEIERKRREKEDELKKRKEEESRIKLASEKRDKQKRDQLTRRSKYSGYSSTLLTSPSTPVSTNGVSKTLLGV